MDKAAKEPHGERKKRKASETERDVFPTRLRKIMEKRNVNQTRLSAKIEENTGKVLQRQTISQYMNGQSKPDTDRLTLLCDALDVSADYLLGISDNWTRIDEVKTASDYTGLSNESIEALRFIHTRQAGDEGLTIDFLNRELSRLGNAIQEAVAKESEYGKLDSIETVFSMMERFILPPDGKPFIGLEKTACSVKYYGDEADELYRQQFVYKIQKTLEARRKEAANGEHTED